MFLVWNNSLVREVQYFLIALTIVTQVSSTAIGVLMWEKDML